MKVLLINGSANLSGCTYTALNEVQKALNENEIETEIISLGNKPIRDCMGCCTCRQNGGKCVFDDDIVNVIAKKAELADGFLFGSPVYYAHPSGRLLSAMDRMFYSHGSAFAYKPAAAVVSARRAGTTASLDAINKHFSINNMPIVSSGYWNMVHGNTPDEVMKDEEGIQVMHILGNNMAWLIKCIEYSKKNGLYHPEAVQKIKTNFIR